jgi:hypothetical protein
MPWLLQLVSAWPHCWSHGGRHELYEHHDDELLAGVEQERRSAGAENSRSSSMTEQEIEQARADVDQLDIEQLRCGVLLQLLHIEALTKERDALAVDAARYRWLRSSRHNDATVMTYVDGLDDWVAWADGEDVDTSVDKALRQAGVQ